MRWHSTRRAGFNALEVALYEEGWISPDRLSDAVARNKKMLGLD